jgi:hypothetical protein
MVVVAEEGEVVEVGFAAVAIVDHMVRFAMFFTSGTSGEHTSTISDGECSALCVGGEAY